ncbi:acyltransferase [Rhizobium sp. TRM96647]|uniref:acyltransferase family protein n=1 Tax=unclassified Rhizobium TaxID=2613769 RepID=UPI0021E774A1|nr:MULTISPECIES: acyltransferase [unclassified Rhizobium]MCV3737248.1 acyltransferase [Rhizobium sp. TRM96647]MCV3759232.1 acyltransferase [Rhizobium sp. TRM96650]
MKTLYGIQYLRAVAAIAVVLFHAAEKTGGHFAIGAAGVDVFFVISGFIMWVITARRPVTPLKFLSDRIVRIVPIYWLATMVMVAGALVGLFPNLELTAGHVVASLLFVPMRSPSSGEIWPVLVQGWTLNFEMFFYLVFALALLLPRARQLATVGVALAALTIAGAFLSTDNALLLTYTRPIILEFAIGMVLGQLWLAGRLPGAAAGLGLVLVAIGGFATIGIFRLPFDEWTCGPLAAALVLGVLALEARGLIRPFALPTLLGNASYSIYLWHTFAISVVAKVGERLHVAPGLTLFLAAFCGIAGGLVAYWLIERPLLSVRRSQARKPVAAGNAVAEAGGST